MPAIIPGVATTGKLRAVISARQSLDRTGEGLAVERQIDACRQLAESRGWEIVEVCVDNSISASTGKNRPGYNRVLDLIRERGYEPVNVAQGNTPQR